MGTPPKKLCTINTPLQLSMWQNYLVHHPDQQFAQFILRGMQFGFRIGRAAVLKSCTFNMLSAKEHLQVLASYLEEGKKMTVVSVGTWPEQLSWGFIAATLV